MSKTRSVAEHLEYGYVYEDQSGCEHCYASAGPTASGNGVQKSLVLL